MRCQWAECSTEIDKPARGRPRKYCAEHAKASAAASKRLYKSKTFESDLAKAIDSRLPQCCQDCRLIHPRRRQCDQHKQWAQFVRDCRKVWRPAERHSNAMSMEEAQFWEVINSKRMRISRNPDGWLADLFSPQPRERILRGVWLPATDFGSLTNEALPQTFDHARA